MNAAKNSHRYHVIKTSIAEFCLALFSELFTPFRSKDNALNVVGVGARCEDVSAFFKECAYNQVGCFVSGVHSCNQGQTKVGNQIFRSTATNS